MMLMLFLSLTSALPVFAGPNSERVESTQVTAAFGTGSDSNSGSGTPTSDQESPSLVCSKPPKTNPMGRANSTILDEIQFNLSKQEGLENIRELKRAMRAHRYVAYAEMQEPNRVNKTKIHPEIEDKLKLDYRLEDSDFLEEGTEIFRKSVPLIEGVYTVALTLNGELVFGKLVNRLEFGVKHHQLAKGEKTVFAGEVLVQRDPLAGRLFIDFNDQSGTFSKPIAAYLKDEEGGRFAKGKDAYQTDLRAYMKSRLEHYYSHVPDLKVGYSKERWSDDLPHPSVEYLRRICGLKGFQDRKSTENPKEGKPKEDRNQKFCKHVEQLDPKTDYSYHPNMLYGMVPVGALPEKLSSKPKPPRESWTWGN